MIRYRRPQSLPAALPRFLREGAAGGTASHCSIAQSIRSCFFFTRFPSHRQLEEPDCTNHTHDVAGAVTCCLWFSVWRAIPQFGIRRV